MALADQFNVDVDDYDDGTQAHTYDKEESELLNSDSDEDQVKLSSSRKQRLSSSKKTKVKEGASLLRVKNWDVNTLESKEYAGKVVNRKDVMEMSDEEAMEADWSEGEPFGASDQDDNDDTQSIDDVDQDDSEKLMRGFEKEDSTQLMSVKDNTKLIEKATHVRNQKIIWERCLEIQIYTKRLLTTVKSISETSSSLPIDQLYACLEAITSLQSSLCNSNELSDTYEVGKKRKRTVDDTWNDIMEMNQEILPQYNTILTTCIHQTKYQTKEITKFKAVNQDVLAQVESILSDSIRVKRKAHPLLDTDALDETMYDDSDFYQQLLKEFIESGQEYKESNGLIQRFYKKKKKQVDRKASKGRVVRYTIHPKLENFMFPEPYPRHEMDINELFRSLFG